MTQLLRNFIFRLNKDLKLKTKMRSKIFLYTKRRVFTLTLVNRFGDLR